MRDEIQSQVDFGGARVGSVVVGNLKFVVSHEVEFILLIDYEVVMHGFTITFIVLSGVASFAFVLVIQFRMSSRCI
jgi:hypothetical protein